MAIPTIVCAAIAVDHLNGDAIILRDVEQSRDNTVTAAGMVLGVALVSMLIESVITAMRFCRRSRVIATVVSINLYSSVCSYSHFQAFPNFNSLVYFHNNTRKNESHKNWESSFIK